MVPRAGIETGDTRILRYPVRYPRIADSRQRTSGSSMFEYYQTAIGSGNYASSSGTCRALPTDDCQLLCQIKQLALAWLKPMGVQGRPPASAPAPPEKTGRPPGSRTLGARDKWKKS